PRRAGGARAGPPTAERPPPPPPLRLATGHQQVQRPADVDLVGAHRVVDRARDGAQRGLVEHALDPRHGPPNCLWIAQVALDQLDSLESRQVLAPAGGEVVEDAHAIAATDQAFHDVRTDETGTAGDQIECAFRHGGGLYASPLPVASCTPARSAWRICRLDGRMLPAPPGRPLPSTRPAGRRSLPRIVPAVQSIALACS